MTSVLIISILFLLSQVASDFLKNYGIPELITYVILGIILGPCVLSLVKPNEILYLFSELGILFLLFESGFEIQLKQGLKTKLESVAVAITGSMVPFFLGLAASIYLFHYNQSESFFIAGSLVATSIGITLKTLMDLKKQKTHVAQVVLIAAVIDDIIGIIMLLIVSSFAQTKTLNLKIAFFVIAYSIALFLIAPIIKLLFEGSLKVFYDKTPTYLSSIIFFAIIFYSFISYKLVHLSILGAFIIGYAIQNVRSKHINILHQAKDKLKPIQNLFEPFFFIYIGLSFNLNNISFSISKFLLALLLLLIIATLGKLLSGFWVNSFTKKIAVGIAMIPRGEVGLIFAQIGKQSGVLNNELYAMIVLISLLTTLITPFALQLMEQKIT